MIYVIDTNCFEVMRSYYPKQFPSFWKRLNELCEEGRLVSVREAWRECEYRLQNSAHLSKWINEHKEIFLPPTEEEMKFISEELFKVEKFLALVQKQNIEKGNPAADPFLIAAAKIKNARLITQETMKGEKIKIPFVCEHFSIKWGTFEQFMESEAWEF